MTDLLTLKAYAKLNLGLRVLGLRDDGFHELHTHMHTIGLFDELTFQKTSENSSIAMVPEVDFPLEKNLVYKAIRLFQEKSGVSENVHCKLKKAIPMGAGLGGGSSDAAATLVALNQLLQTNISDETLASWGAELGSDIPFFIYGGFACARGRGEKLLPLISTYKRHHFVVMVPPIECSTPQVYQSWDAHFSTIPRRRISCEQMDHQNDLQAAACHRYPELNPYGRLIQSAPTELKGMSGSGSAWYAGFPNQEEAEAYRNELETLVDDAQIYCVKTV